MKRDLDKRLGTLERIAPANKRRWARIIVHPHESETEVMEREGVSSDANLIIHKIVWPAAGSMDVNRR